MILVPFACAAGVALAEEPADTKVATEEAVAKSPEVAAEPALSSEASPKKDTHQLPKYIEEVVQMSEAGMSPLVLTTFIENSGIAYEPTGADLLAMKKRGVPDEVMVVMLAKSAAIKAEYDAARKAASKRIAAPAIVRSLSTDGELDPESYEFFWYHHAYPRALAGSYRTLAPYAQSFYFDRPHRYRRDRGPTWPTDGFDRNSLRSRSSSGFVVRSR
jgi:hypothetical protein